MIYQEKHVGTGNGLGQRSIDPVTEIYLEEGSELEMDSLQLGGVDHTLRKTSGVVGEGRYPDYSGADSHRWRAAG